METTYEDQNRPVDTLLSALSSLNIYISREKAHSLLTHLELLQNKNKELNLTALDSFDEGIVLHIVDSLTLLDSVSQAKEPLLDLGSGGGFPGIPLAVATEFHTTLLDSISKKATALQSFVDDLMLSNTVEVLCARAEELAQLRPRYYGAVCARAVAPLAVLIEYATPLLKYGGLLIAAKGQPSEEELVSGDAAAKLCGMRRISQKELALPYGKGIRNILVYERFADPQLNLPRAVGKARKKPLA